jgi:hypothetical protein
MRLKKSRDGARLEAQWRLMVWKASRPEPMAQAGLLWLIEIVMRRCRRTRYED